MPKQARLTGIKAFRCYTFDEAAEITGVSTRTIRNWSRNGLPLLAAERPIFVRGDDLCAFIKAQRESRRVKTALHEFYCCRCRGPRQAAEGFADCLIDGKRITVTALCATCETVVSKSISEVRIPELAQTLDLTITRRG